MSRRRVSDAAREGGRPQRPRRGVHGGPPGLHRRQHAVRTGRRGRARRGPRGPGAWARHAGGSSSKRPPGTARTPESAYWDRETRLKEAEGRLGACLGANGGIYAAERVLVSPLPPGHDVDGRLPDPGAHRPGRAGASPSPATPWPARTPRRTSPPKFGGGRASGSAPARSCAASSGSGTLARHPVLTFAFASRKAARWLAPLLALAAAAAALFVPRMAAGRSRGARRRGSRAGLRADVARRSRARSGGSIISSC